MNVVVSDLVPGFQQNPQSYIRYPTLRDAYLQFDIEIAFRPDATDGKFYLANAFAALVWLGLNIIAIKCKRMISIYFNLLTVEINAVISVTHI